MAGPFLANDLSALAPDNIVQYVRIQASFAPWFITLYKNDEKHEQRCTVDDFLLFGETRLCGPRASKSRQERPSWTPRSTQERPRSGPVEAWRAGGKQVPKTTQPFRHIQQNPKYRCLRKKSPFQFSPPRHLLG